MKKTILIITVMITANVYALAGIGIHFGIDNTSVDAYTENEFRVSMGGAEYRYSLTRDEIKSPLVFGGQLYFDIPVFPLGFELDFEGAWASYEWRGGNSLTGPNGENIELRFTGYDYPDTEYSEQFEFGRVSADVTAKWYIFSLPPVVKTFKFYVGGGAGFHYITPIVSEELIKHELETRYSDLNPDNPPQDIGLNLDEYMEKFASFGYHGVAGVALKLPALPIAFNLDYKYTVTDANDYDDPTNKFSVIKGSMSLYF